MVDFLKDISKKLNYHFCYGKMHWQNLGDFPLQYDMLWEERKKYFHLIFVNRTNQFNDFNAIDTINFEGTFILSVRSKITDQDYEFKHEHNIKGLQLEIESILKNITACSSMQITRWKETEVEDMFDANLDGLKIDFTIKENITDLEFNDQSYQFYLISFFRNLKEKGARIEAKECLTELYKFLNNN